MNRLAQTIGASGADSVSELLRHFGKIKHWHLHGKPEDYESDIADVNERDFLGLLDEVVEWRSA